MIKDDLFKKVPMIISFALLTACAGPRHVESSVALVSSENYQHKSAISENFWEPLNSSAPGQEIKQQQRRFVVGASYISALGHTCKELSELTQSNQVLETRIVCQPEGYRFWYLVPDISSYGESLSRL